MGTKISALPAAATLGGTEKIPGVQAGADVATTVDQIKTYVSGTAVSVQTGAAYTAVLADANTYIRFNSASAQAFTIPPNSAVAFPVGTLIEFEQMGTGILSVAAGSGVTLLSRGSDFTLFAQYSIASVRKVASDTWVLTGDL